MFNPLDPNTWDQGDTVPATVLWRLSDNRQIASIEVDGQVFTPARDQVEERRTARLEHIRRHLAAIIPAADAALVSEFESLWEERIADVVDYKLRQVGYTLLNTGRRDVWESIYARVNPNDDEIPAQG